MTARTRRWVWGLLAASLAVNLFLGTWLAVYGLRSYMRSDTPPSLFSSVRAVKHLDPEDPALGGIWQRYSDTLHKNYQDLRTARVELRDVLEAPVLDGPELVRSLAQVEAGTLAMQRTLHEFLLHAAEQMTPAQRKDLSDSVLRKRSRDAQSQKDGTSGADKPADGDSNASGQ